MTVDIYIKEKKGSREIRIPWLPEKIEVESGGTTVASYDIMDKGEVVVPTGSGLITVSWQSEFPGKNRTDKAMQRGTWRQPSYYHNILEDWRKNGTELNVLVTGYPINVDVYLSDYNSAPTGGFGDLAYQIKLIEARDITVKTTKNSEASSTTRSATKSTTYTIKSGDTLWAIAEKYLGSGAEWQKIYNANKEIIESTAKSRWSGAGANRDSENGHWIFPGVTITIPQ